MREQLRVVFLSYALNGSYAICIFEVLMCECQVLSQAREPSWAIIGVKKLKDTIDSIERRDRSGLTVLVAWRQVCLQASVNGLACFNRFLFESPLEERLGIACHR